MFTSTEKLIIERFTPYKLINIQRNGQTVKTIKTTDTTATLKELKRKYRIQQKLRVAPSVEFSFIDERGRNWASYGEHINSRKNNYYMEAAQRLQALRKKHKAITILKYHNGQ